MSHYYAYCYCRECLKMDLNDRNRYDSNDAYCTEYHRYINPNDHACCSEHFIYNESLSSSSGCYITTIVCDIMNLDDDCEYLNKLRNFRDGYMKKDPTLYPLLYEYDIIGPIIVSKLKNDYFKHIRSLMILENYIKPIVKLLDNKEYSAAIESYKKMVIELKSFYQIRDIIIDVDINSLDISHMGHGKSKKIIKKVDIKSN